MAIIDRRGSSVYIALVRHVQTIAPASYGHYFFVLEFFQSNTGGHLESDFQRRMIREYCAQLCVRGPCRALDVY